MKLPDTIAIEGTYHQYCIVCFRESVERTFDEAGRTRYHCASCGDLNERSLVIDPSVESWLDGERNYWHRSVGIVVHNTNDEILLFKRSIFPFAHTIPAGHVDVGEKPLEAARRELREEAGITTDALSLLFEGVVPGDSCRRGSDHHHWHLFAHRVDRPVTVAMHDDEGAELGWYDVRMVPREERTPALNFFLDRGII